MKTEDAGLAVVTVAVIAVLACVTLMIIDSGKKLSDCESWCAPAPHVVANHDRCYCERRNGALVQPRRRNR